MTASAHWLLLTVLTCMGCMPSKASADLMEDHARLMEGAIVADDEEQIKKLLATPYVNPSGFRYRTGRKVIWINHAAANGKLQAVDAILAAKPTRAKIETYAEDGQRWVPANWLIVSLHAERGDVLREFDYVIAMNRLLKAGLGPQASNELGDFGGYWLQLYSVGSNGSIDRRSAESLLSGLEHFGLGFSKLIPHMTWPVALPISAISRFDEVAKVVKDFSLVDRNGNSILNELLLVDDPNRLAWLQKIVVSTPMPRLDQANSAGFFPADFIWFHAPNGNGRLCMASPDLILVKPGKKRRWETLRSNFGNPDSWPRKGYASCGNTGRCSDCLGPGA